MPESTEDIQDIDQLVAQADTLVAELAAVTTATIQSASDEGPTIEPPEWAPPVESKASDVESPDDSTSKTTEPPTEPPTELAAEPTQEPAAELRDSPDPAATPTSDTVSADEPEPVASAPSASIQAGADSVADRTAASTPQSVSDATPESTSQPATESTSEVSAESAQADSQTSESPESASSRDGKSQPSVDQTAQNDTASSADSVDPIESSEAGQAIRLDDPPPDPPETLSQGEPETTQGAQEPVCEIESDESEHEPAGDILMDDAPSDPQSEKPELLADASAGSIQDTTEASERVRSLDDELAKLADEMIEGEGDSDDNTSVLMNATSEADDGSPASEETIASKQALPSQRDGAAALSNASGSSSASAGSGTPNASRPQQADQPASSRPAAFKDRVWFYTKIAARRTVEIARERGPVIAAQLEPVARRACEQASKPLDKKKPIVRKTIGWVAASTAVYASVVLFYVAFIRKPPTIEPDQPGTTLIDDTGRPIASHPDGN